VALSLASLLVSLGALAHPGHDDGATAEPSAVSSDSGNPEPSGGAPLTRERLVRSVLERSPALLVERTRAETVRREGRAAARLPSPTISAEVAEIPLSQPWAVQDARMVRLGFEQMFPPSGVREAMSEAKRAEAEAVEAARRMSSRELARDAEHAFADYFEAVSMAEAHGRHHQASSQVLALTQARIAAGGSLTDVAQAEREVEMVAAEMLDAEAQVEVARARLNGLLLRPAQAPLGPPQVEDLPTLRCSPS
jgi:cobalt-zinc-cadmium efflux system outer membrane protein